MRTARSAPNVGRQTFGAKRWAPSVCACAPARSPFLSANGNDAWRGRVPPAPAEVANDPPRPRAAALYRQCQRHPRGERGGTGPPPDRSRAMALPSAMSPQKTAAKIGLTVYVQQSSEGRIRSCALCRPGRRERRCQRTPPANGAGDPRRSVTRMAGDTATPRKGKAADGARGSNRTQTPGWSSPSGGLSPGLRQIRLRHPWHASGHSLGTPPPGSPWHSPLDTANRAFYYRHRCRSGTPWRAMRSARVVGPNARDDRQKLRKISSTGVR
jgi:hypothetical protein